MLQREEALEVARRLVDASTADETEVVVHGTRDRFARFAADGPTQSADREGAGVSVRARLRTPDGWREASASCDGLGEAQTLRTLRRACELAALAPPDPEQLPLGGPVEVRAQAADLATVEHAFAEKARWIAAATAACRAEGLVPAGLAQTLGTSRTLVTSAGREVHASRSRASFQLTASGPDFVHGAGFADTRAARASELDADDVVRRAVHKAAAGREARSVAAGEYTVVLEPNAVSALLLFAAYQGFGAQDVAEESSFLCGRVGQRLFPEALSIDDDAHAPENPALPFDGEGSPRRRAPLVERGVLVGPVTDALWAHKLGCANTGHGLPRPNTSGPKAEHLVVHPGAESLAQLVAGVERGLLVTQFHYTNLIDPKELLLTGMTRNGTFLIENGELGPAVKNLRFTESLVRALGNLSGVGRERAVAGALFDGEVLTPALRLENFRFTSTTDF
ncbi:MAG: TldD/PmbA family protein [Planctomycetes bacterium]|nr:TldD/PmbA family protein [Planctomycetota bacterium]